MAGLPGKVQYKLKSGRIEVSQVEQQPKKGYFVDMKRVASYNPLLSRFIHQLTCLDSRFDSEAAFLCRFSECVERCLYLLADDLGSHARALAVCRAGEIDAGNLTRVLVGLRKLGRALLAALETALASCPRAVIL